ncbi:MAG: hypothetical protein V1837_00050 [Candidatus Woesearchaeota archaeon]
MKIRSLVLVFFVVVCALPVYALTASIGNARMILNTEVVAGTPTVLEKSIKVNNVNNVSVDVTLVTSGDIKSFTEMLDKTLTLQPGESKDARFVMSLQYGGRYDGKILVTFKPSDPNVKSTPVGLASTIIIIAQGPANPNPPQPDTEDTDVVPNPTVDSGTVDEQPSDNKTTTVKEPTKVPGKANPAIGIAIIIAVLAIGSILYWWYMKR